MSNQISMFTEGQDLPLLSQTPVKAKARLFKRVDKPVQTSLFNVKCGLCYDTGLVGIDKKVCICQR
jgi:hypothetical protein